MCVIEVIIIYKTLDKLTINKYPVMNNYLRKAGSAVVTATCSALGAMHFITDTSSDLLLAAEARLIRNRDGVEEEVTKNARVRQTVIYQQHILDKAEAFKHAIDEAKARIKGGPFESEYPTNLSNLILVNAEVIRAEQ